MLNPKVQQQEELEREREQLVVKSNALIQRTRYSLSTQEQKVILYLISKIKPETIDFDDVEISIKHLCEVCGIETYGGNYKYFKDTIEKLANKSFWIKNGKEEILCRWIAKVKINTETNNAVIRLDNDLKPYLLKLRDNFTIYELDKVLVMRSKYSIRLYEILKSYLYIGYYAVSVADLKKILNTAEYSEWYNLRRNVIDVAVREINKYTDLQVEYKTSKTGKAISDIYFTISLKEENELIQKQIDRRRLLNNG